MEKTVQAANMTRRKSEYSTNQRKTQKIEKVCFVKPIVASVDQLTADQWKRKCEIEIMNMIQITCMRYLVINFFKLQLREPRQGDYSINNGKTIITTVQKQKMLWQKYTQWLNTIIIKILPIVSKSAWIIT